MVPGTAWHVLRDVGIHQVSAAGLKVHVSVANIGFSFAQRLYFGAMQHEAGFQLLKDMIIIRGRAILRDNLLLRALGVFALLRFFRRLHHNLSFYLMPRLMRMTPYGAPARSQWRGQQMGENTLQNGLAHGTV